MSKITTIKELNERAWYRLLKVIIIIVYIFSVLMTFEVVAEDGYLVVFLNNLIIYAVYYIIKGSFYYVALGAFRPK